MNESDQLTKEQPNPFLNWFFILLILGCLYATVLYIGIEDLGVYVERAGVWGPIVLILAKITTIVVAPLGGSPLYPIAGALFGSLHGFLYIFLGDALGASIAFYISRKFGRRAATRFVSERGMVMVERILAYLGTSRGMLEARLYFIAFPEFVSYAAGLTRIPYSTFITIHLLIYAAPIAIIVWLGDAIVGLHPLQFVMLAGVASLGALVGGYFFYRKAKHISSDSPAHHHD